MTAKAIVLAAILSLGAAGALSAQQAPTKAVPKKTTGAVPRTAWGHPDLEGIWDNHSITPLERPARFAGREFLTPQEVAEVEKRAADENADEARFADKERDVEAAYNDFWWDRATTVPYDRAVQAHRLGHTGVPDHIRRSHHLVEAVDSREYVAEKPRADF